MKQVSLAHKCAPLVLAMALAACGAEHTAALPTQSAAARHTQALGAGECDLDGTWAIKIKVPVSWDGTTVLVGGRGELTQYVKAKRSRNGNVVRESLTVCGISLPDYRSVVFQRFATRFPDSLFDNDYLGTIDVDSRFNSFAPGATFQTESVVSELGVAMSDPRTDAWPLRGVDIMQHVVDSDQDGHPGVTLHAAPADEGYSLPPTRFPNFAPATKFYAAIRNIADISGTQQTCDLATGVAVIPKINGKAALNSHVLGCELKTGGQCAADQTSMLDRNQPAYQPIDDNPGTVVMMRVDDDATCETIRNYEFISL